MHERVDFFIGGSSSSPFLQHFLMIRPIISVRQVLTFVLFFFGRDQKRTSIGHSSFIQASYSDLTGSPNEVVASFSCY